MADDHVKEHIAASVPNETTSENEEKPVPLIAAAVNSFLHRTRDIEMAAKAFIPASAKLLIELADVTRNELEEAMGLLEKDDDVSRVMGMKITDKAVRRLERLDNSKLPWILQNSLFLGLFSAYDAFTGDLLSAIYQQKPELYTKMDRSISVQEALRCKSFDDLKNSVLSDEIESFRRESYVQQFKELENTFGLPLRKFDRWPQFVECSQRRNLLTHCDGIVSKQYLTICKQEGVSLPLDLSEGHQINLDKDYFFTTCDLMMEVGLKLGQTLWRKLFPEEVEAADEHMTNVIYDYLSLRKWQRAAIASEFFLGQKHTIKDRTFKVAKINYAIALKFGGHADDSKGVLNSVDWSGALIDFQLAKAVLEDKYTESAELMKRLGKESELVSEESYHIWPLFNDFRNSKEFLDAYNVVYGYSFIAEIKKAAGEAKKQSESQQEELAATASAKAADPENDGIEV